MQVVEVLAVDQQIQHIVALSANLQACLNPIKFCRLEELCFLKSFKQISLACGLRLFVMQGVLNPTFKQFLVRNSNFYRVTLRKMFFEPVAY
jgi:hypothetical protein